MLTARQWSVVLAVFWFTAIGALLLALWFRWCNAQAARRDLADMEKRKWER
jgi:hypothetical protein